MSSQLQRERAEHPAEDWDVEHVEPAPQAKAAELSKETSDMLDEIDDLLEENAQEFVETFIQRGGE